MNSNKMKPYTELATVYDHLLRHVNYQEWYDYIKSIMNHYCESPKIIIELGCGTGRFGAKFSNDDYTIFGIDKSLSMLHVAKARAYSNFKILCADITNFYLKKKIDFIFSVHDTMNYLLEDIEIKNALRSIKNIMHDKSIFMFDITTEYNINKNFNNKKSTHTVRNTHVVWNNFYDNDKKIIYSTLNLTKRNGITAIEEHIQKIYSIKQIEKILCEEGFEILEIFGDYSYLPPQEDTIMINFVTRKA